MNQQDVLTILEDEEIRKNLDVLGQIHMLTKHYLLIAEELSEEGVTFLQPLKEHRDAYDHLMRVFYLPIRLETSDIASNFDSTAYIRKNVEKALGHEYRAFFDMADWLTFICRRKIREEMSYQRVRQAYVNQYGIENYKSVKELVNTVYDIIAQYRAEKDIGKAEPPLQDVQSYQKTIDQLLDIYKKVMTLDV